MKSLGERRTIYLIVWSLWGREGRFILLYEVFRGEKDDLSYCMKHLGKEGRLLLLYEVFGGEKDDWSYCMKPLGERNTIALIVWSLWGREGRLIVLYEVFEGREGRLILLYEVFGREKDGWSYCMKSLGERRTIDLIVWSLWGREGWLILLYEVFGGEKDGWYYWKTSYNKINRPSLPQRLHTIRSIVLLSPKDFIQ
jgi:hypothetical protein